MVEDPFLAAEAVSPSIADASGAEPRQRTGSSNAPPPSVRAAEAGSKGGPGSARSGVADDSGPGGPDASPSPPASDQAVRTVSHTAADASSGSVRSAVTFTPAEARQPLPSGREGEAASAAGVARLPAGVPPSDEYLFDGGDRFPPIHYGPFGMQGLNTEDAVAEYRDHEGERHIQPSNRVAVYAPRFGAVRSVSRPAAGTSVDRLASATDHLTGVGVRNRQAPTHHIEQLQPEGIQRRSRASGVETGSAAKGMEQVVLPGRHVKLINAFENLAFLRSGKLDQTQQARLGEAVEAAVIWTRDQNPVITASTSAGMEVYASFKAAEIVGVEDKRTKGRLRIVKLADKKAARPGEVVTLTIRYDNLGDRELREVRILDNLTPRLEYVDESMRSERPGTLSVERNEEGSVVLEFELDEPLPGHEGGVLTFQARVR